MENKKEWEEKIKERVKQWEIKGGYLGEGVEDKLLKLIGGRYRGKMKIEEAKLKTWKLLNEQRAKKRTIFSIGIDLAIGGSGIAIFKNYELEIIQGVRLPKFENTKEWYDNAQKTWYKAFDDTLYRIAHRCIVGETPIEINVKIELSNFSSPKVTQRFSFLAGIIYSSICNLFRYDKNVKTNLYMLNANTWFEYFNKHFTQIQDWTHIPRSERKKYSISYFLNHLRTYDNNQIIRKIFFGLSDDDQSDIADAFWIGFFDYEHNT